MQAAHSPDIPCTSVATGQVVERVRSVPLAGTADRAHCEARQDPDVRSSRIGQATAAVSHAAAKAQAPAPTNRRYATGIPCDATGSACETTAQPRPNPLWIGNAHHATATRCDATGTACEATDSDPRRTSHREPQRPTKVVPSSDRSARSSLDASGQNALRPTRAALADATNVPTCRTATPKSTRECSRETEQSYGPCNHYGQVLSLSPSFEVPVVAQGRECIALLDSGATDNFISLELSEQLPCRSRPLRHPFLVRVANGDILRVDKYLRVQIRFATVSI